MQEGEEMGTAFWNNLATEMDGKLNGPLPKYWRDIDRRRTRCIYRVPKLLRQTNEEAYTPVLIPIGPYHHPKSQAEVDKTVEGLKLNYLKSFVDNNPVMQLPDYIRIVKERETIIHAYYTDHTISLSHREYDSKQFIEMVLTDSAFLIELFRKGVQQYAEDDLIWSNPSLKYEVFRDIFLMENQLPFFILRDLLSSQLLNLQGDDNNSIANRIATLVANFLRGNYGIVLNVNALEAQLEPEQILIPHLLDLVRSHYVGGLNNAPQAVDEPAPEPQLNNGNSNDLAVQVAQQPQQNNGNGNDLEVQMAQQPQQNIRNGNDLTAWHPQQGSSSSIIVFPNATKLVGANVKFQQGDLLKFDSDYGCFWWKGGKLTLPKLTVGGGTECLFRNLIAYERCHYPNEPYLISYIYFMNCLIRTRGDVQMLTEAGVVESTLGSEDNLSQMLNSLCNNIDFTEYDYLYSNQTKQINEHYRGNWNHYIASLYQTHFANPWTICSFLAAIILLVLTLIQTVASCKQAYFPK